MGAQSAQKRRQSGAEPFAVQGWGTAALLLCAIFALSRSNWLAWEEDRPLWGAEFTQSRSAAGSKKHSPDPSLRYPRSS